MDATKVCLNLMEQRQVPFCKCTQFKPNMMEEVDPTQSGITIMEDALNLAKTGRILCVNTVQTQYDGGGSRCLGLDALSMAI